MKNTIINIEGVIMKVDGGVINEKEHDNLIDSILEVLENKGYSFGGGTCLTSDNSLF
jgi:hypothetical protein